MGNQIHAGTMIYGITQEQAVNHMNELVKNSGETIVRRNHETVYTNDNKYMAKFLGEHCRAYRYLNVYVSKETLLDESCDYYFWDVVVPNLVPPSYYDINKFHDDDYNWMEHIFIY